ncbi:MAG: hypothetical protein ACJA2Z_000523, partial [Candidatus Paceibacteria bacterium]
DGFLFSREQTTTHLLTNVGESQPIRCSYRGRLRLRYEHIQQKI